MVQACAVHRTNASPAIVLVWCVGHGVVWDEVRGSTVQSMVMRCVVVFNMCTLLIVQMRIKPHIYVCGVVLRTILLC